MYGMQKKNMIVAFDCDMTLVRYDETPNYDVVWLFRWFYNRGHQCIVWSGGGKEWAQHWRSRLFDPSWNIIVSAKTKEAAAELKPDIVVDDEFVEFEGAKLLKV